MLVIFDNLDNVGKTIADIISNKVIPATLEIMTMLRSQLRIIQNHLPVDAEAVLVIEVDGSIEDVVLNEFETVKAIYRKRSSLSKACTE